MRVLFLTPKAVTAPESGGLQVTLERIRGLSAFSTLTVAHLRDDGREPPRLTGGLEPIELASAGTLRGRTAWSLVASYLQGLPLSVWRNSDPAFVRAARALEHRWDLVYVDHWLMWKAAAVIPARRRVLHLHNAENVLIGRAAAGMLGVRRWIARAEQMRATRFLREIVDAVDELHLLSDADKGALADSGVRHSNTKVFLPAILPSPGSTPAFDERDRIALFVGTLSWLPNAEGLCWYLSAGWPLRKGASRLEVVGGGADESVRRAVERSPSTILRGFMSDLDPSYASAKCLVAPLLSGSGVKIKIINALARGLPVVTTAIGCEGMPESGGAGVLVARTADEFAAHVDRLMVDEQYWTAASASAREYVARHFSGAEFRAWCGALAGEQLRHAS